MRGALRIFVAHRGRDELAIECLKRWKAEIDKWDGEVEACLHLDGGSSMDQTFRDLLPEWEVFSDPTAKGIQHVRRMQLLMAGRGEGHGARVLFFDTDTVPDEGALEACEKAFKFWGQPVCGYDSAAHDTKDEVLIRGWKLPGTKIAAELRKFPSGNFCFISPAYAHLMACKALQDPDISWDYCGWAAGNIIPWMVLGLSEHIGEGGMHDKDNGGQGRDKARIASGHVRHEAEKIREAIGMIESPILISVLHPTCRFDVSSKVREEWLKLAKNPRAIEWVYGIDAKEQERIGSLLGGKVVVDGENRLGAVSKINACAKNSLGDVLVMAADDIYPPEDWDVKVLAAIPDTKGEYVLACPDGNQGRPDLIHNITITRKRYERYGYVIHPAFYHLYGDDFFTAQAVADKVVVRCPGIVFDHRHPTTGKSQVDAVYARTNSQEQYTLGAQIYKDLLAKHNLKQNEERII